MRSVADQTTRELGGALSVLARQRSDHVKLDALLRELRGAEGDHEALVLMRIHRLVFPHAFAEESVLWPLMRRVLDDGQELTLEVEREHQEVNELVTTLETLPSGDPGRAPLLDRLVEVLREDVRDEEDELFPRLQERVRVRDLRLLGIAWEAVRRTAPTRAHPVVSRRPPGNALAAVPLSVIDRARDAVDLLRHRGPVAWRPALGTAGDALRRAAHRVEHLPLLRRGEDASTRFSGAGGGAAVGTGGAAAATA
ncbi:cation-binding protein [Clavibacter michiganensis]|uniref:hemerythrin domain-containing protein n=1 Tax=Clavibacter michiganensis TaxID=28447 RepID=UPI000CE7BD78|nr:hemerythrin domain-containing protein [Clavibacter michiganensis]PPF55746.1 cation-binding protein [Clavibacter michiganensis]